MVSTRGHPKDFSEPELSPSKPTATRGKKQNWAHTPSNLSILWLFVSLPLVIWDTGYMLLRPWTMPGGKLYSPLWVPYKLYGTVDYVYGQLAYDEKNGFSGAQSFMNTIETILYAYYLYIVFAHGRPSTAQGRGAPDQRLVGFLGQQRSVDGKRGRVALLIAYSAAVMTVSKTLLYWMCEYYSGFRHIGHNDLQSLVFLWMIPNGAWLVVPSYVIYVTGVEILQGLAIAAGDSTPLANGLAVAKLS